MAQAIRYDAVYVIGSEHDPAVVNGQQSWTQLIESYNGGGLLYYFMLAAIASTLCLNAAS